MAQPHRSHVCWRPVGGVQRDGPITINSEMEKEMVGEVAELAGLLQVEADFDGPGERRASDFSALSSVTSPQSRHPPEAVEASRPQSLASAGRAHSSARHPNPGPVGLRGARQ